LKKLTDSVRFWFYKPETEKTEPNRIQTEQNRKNRAEPNPNQAKPKKLIFVQKN
jgi:hypothetical protein